LAKKTINPDLVDWNQVWMDAQWNNIDSGYGGECWNAWTDKESAKEYFRKSQNSAAVQERIADLSSLIHGGSRVLDIGAGPGNITLVLAKTAAHLTAVEPAQGMVSVLMEQIALENAGNILLVNKKWDDIEREDLRPPYDLTFASFSLGMIDLEACIKKMMSVTSGEIVIYWHAGIQSWDQESMELWPLLHNRAYSPVPQSNIILNLLYSMGIYPDVKVLRHNRRICYDTFEEALESYARRFDADNGEKRALLADYLEGKFITDGSKKMLFSHDVSMRISWKMKITTITRVFYSLTS
jgi:SAM-dependent methyltransferase